MIFDINNNGAKELRQITGNFYASNNFDRIRMDVQLATDELAQVVGSQVIELAEKEYQNGTSDDLVMRVQYPIAMLATVRFYQKNDLSHEDSGRKVKLASDGTDKIPWEWQLDRDDAIHLELYYQGVERLIRYLNKAKVKEWIESDGYKLASSLLIRSGREFDAYFPIDKSERLFMLLEPFIQEVQIKIVKPAFGSGWGELLKDDGFSDLRFSACKATALLAMSTALRRMPLQLIPSAVIRGYAAEHGAKNSTPATIDEVRTLANWLEQDAADWIDRMKEIRDGDQDYSIDFLPKNNRHNKFFRT